MANFVFNNARGRIAHLATLPASNDAFIAVPLETTGLEADETLRDYSSLGALLAGSSNEQTTMGRKTLSGLWVSVDNTANTRTVTADTVTWTSASGNAISAVVICYVENVSVSDDGPKIPLIKLDFPQTPSGANISMVFSPDGFWRSTS